MSKVLFPGSFNPFTKGHADIVKRALEIFDKVVIAVGINEQKSDTLAAVKPIADLYRNDDRVTVISYSCLTADLCAQLQIRTIVRGVRDVKDYEYERQMADVNHQLVGVETILLFASPQLSSLSSSVLRELSHFGKDITPFLP